MVRNFDGAGELIEQWLKNKGTVLFPGVWERINNPDFDSLEFEGIKNEAGRNSFFLSAKKWIDLTGAKGLMASAGRYGGTYAHKDIAFEFGSWGFQLWVGDKACSAHAGMDSHADGMALGEIGEFKKGGSFAA